MTETEQDRALDKAMRLADRSDEFTPEERRALKKVAQFWRGMEALGWVAGLLRNNLVIIGALVGGMIMFRETLAAWLLGGVK